MLASQSYAPMLQIPRVGISRGVKLVANPTFVPAGGPGVRGLEHIVVVLVHEQPVVVLLQRGTPVA